MFLICERVPFLMFFGNNSSPKHQTQISLAGLLLCSTRRIHQTNSNFGECIDVFCVIIYCACSLAKWFIFKNIFRLSETTTVVSRQNSSVVATNQMCFSGAILYVSNAVCLPLNEQKNVGATADI